MRCFEEMAGRLGLQHSQLAYVADNPAKDFVAPNTLGWLTIRIRRPGTKHGRCRSSARGTRGLG